ncbi:hypothetical protein GCM10023322_31320 [Rugosimonospora acidiphila]|uniref:Ricin B lectin domain-containing protein n=1 Tax=Rugosimonospora acidiphila TaxID=556531 RepID=A0ABP9RRZ0_9ACTN
MGTAYASTWLAVGVRLARSVSGNIDVSRFLYDSGGRVVGVESGLRLEVTGGGTANGTAVEISMCNGGSNQNWTQG